MASFSDILLLSLPSQSLTQWVYKRCSVLLFFCTEAWFRLSDNVNHQQKERAITALATGAHMQEKWSRRGLQTSENIVVNKTARKRRVFIKERRRTIKEIFTIHPTVHTDTHGPRASSETSTEGKRLNGTWRTDRGNKRQWKKRDYTDMNWNRNTQQSYRKMGNKEGKKNIALDTKEEGTALNLCKSKASDCGWEGCTFQGHSLCISISFSSPTDNTALAFQGQEGHTPPRATTAHTLRRTHTQ